MTTPSVRTYQFGPFLVNPLTGELLKGGERVRLQDQPFRLLVILLEKAGQVVTRDEIQSRIWQNNTFGDFDSGVRVAVRKLREALGDDADHPHYIETLPKRGYRLLVPVTSRGLSAELPGAPPAESRFDASKRRSGDGLWVWAAVAIILLVAFTSAPLIHHRKLAGGEFVVLADFANTTGDPVFDGTLRQGMAVQLEQSPYMSLVSDERIQRALGFMGQPPGVRLTPELARDVCQRTGATAVLEGSIARLGSQYVLGLRARNCANGDVLDEEQARAQRKEDVLSALDTIAGKFRSRVGESLATIQKFNTPLVEATTSSLDALKAYSMGWQVVGSEGESAALPFFRRAVEIDPQFAAAYGALGLMYGSTGESALAAENITKAYKLRDRVSGNERFFITAYYAGRTLGNQQKTQQTCEDWARDYPREWRPHSFLAGFVDPVLGDFQGAVRESQKMIQMNPENGVGYLFLAYNHLALNQFDEAGAAIKQGAEHKAQVPDFSLFHFDLAFLRSDQASMVREAASAHDSPAMEERLNLHQAFALAYTGRLQEARRLAGYATESAHQKSHMENAALSTIAPALWEAFFGESLAARQNADRALAIAQDREIQYGAALALALAGDTGRAEELANDLEKRYPEDTSVRFSYVPVLRGVLAINRRDPLHAIEDLQPAIPYELGTPRSWMQGFFGALYPVYIRGEAYLAAHRAADAAREFQKILDHRGIVISDPIGALAWLQLGRAYAEMHDKVKARTAYQQFLALWKNADPRLPILRQAKAEYAHLS